MVLPVNLAKVQGSQTQSPGGPPPYGQVVWQGVYVINVTTSGFNLGIGIAIGIAIGCSPFPVRYRLRLR